MTKQPSEDDTFFKDPNKIVQKTGEIVTEAVLATVKSLPATTTAMAKVADAEVRDDMAKRKGTDDYRLSLEKLLDGLDTFVREQSNGRHGAGWTGNYDLSNSCDLTLSLLWQIRHTWSHHGSVVDKKCKKEYEKTFKNALEQKTKPIINLPAQLEIGHGFSVNYENYRLIKKCFFSYIGRKIPENDLKILRKRSSFTNFKIQGPDILVHFDSRLVQINLAEAFEYGCDIDTETKTFTMPPDAVFIPQLKKIVLRLSGDSFSARLVTQKDLKKMMKIGKKKATDGSVEQSGFFLFEP